LPEGVSWRETLPDILEWLTGLAGQGDEVRGDADEGRLGFGDPQVIQDGRHPIFGTKVLGYAANGREALDR
jgi:hypothetical protein